MTKPWFRPKKPGEGFGWDINSRTGLYITLGFIAVTMLTGLAGTSVGGRSPMSVTITVIIVLAETLGFLKIVRDHSS